MTIKEALWFVEQDVWRSIQEYRTFNNMTKANILQQALNIVLHSFPDRNTDVVTDIEQKKFILLKGKIKNGDEYFNPSYIRSFDIYEDDNGNKFLNICFPSDKVRQFSEKAYEIEDFVEQLKALECD